MSWNDTPQETLVKYNEARSKMMDAKYDMDRAKARMVEILVNEGAYSALAPNMKVFAEIAKRDQG